jgi:cyclase
MPDIVRPAADDQHPGFRRRRERLWLLIVSRRYCPGTVGGVTMRHRGKCLWRWQEARVYVDDLACEVRHVGTPAHTTNDSIVWIPDRSLLFSGDLLFRGGTPFLLMGSLAGAIGVLEELKRLPASTIVPGHGAVSGPELIDDVLGYLRFVTGAAAAARAAGLSPLDAARQLDLGPYAGLLDAERIVGNLHRAYAELDGAPPGARIDVAAALADMVAYNGGRPLSCYA